VRHVVESILRDQNTVLTVSTLLAGQLGVSDICLSLPCIVDGSGRDKMLSPQLNEAELMAFLRSAEVVARTAREAGL
jgi:L-lactate dehydrogenase